MKNKNGFTLIEIIITIVILGIIGVITISIIKNIKDSSIINAQNIFKANLKKSAIIYTEEYYNKIKWNIYSTEEAVSEYEFTCVPIKFLIDKGYLKPNIKMPGTREDVINQKIKIERNKDTKVINNELFINDDTCEKFDKKIPIVNVIVKEDDGNILDINNMVWSNKNIIQIIDANDENGIYSIKINYKDETKIFYDKKIELIRSTEINNNVIVTVTDNLGNEAQISYPLKIDKTAPSCVINASGLKSTTNSAWFINKPTINLSYQDNGNIKSNIKFYDLTLSKEISYNKNYTFSNIEDTKSTLYYGYVKDEAGNINSCSIEIKSDSAKPTTPSITGGTDTWKSTNITIKINTQSVSFSGVSYYEYCVISNNNANNCIWQKITNANFEQIFSTNQDNYIYYKAVNVLGVESDISNYQRVRIDKVTPTINLNSVSSSFVQGTSINLPSSVTYGISGGITTCQYNNITITNTNVLPMGNYQITCAANGNNGLNTTINKWVTVTSPCECSHDSQCGTNYSCNGCDCYYDPQCECSHDSQCGTNYSCNGCDCYYDPQCECSKSSQCRTNYSCDGCDCYYDPPTTCGTYGDSCPCCSGYVCSRTHSYCVPSGSGGGGSSGSSCSCPCGRGYTCINGACCKKDGTHWACCK